MYSLDLTRITLDSQLSASTQSGVQSKLLCKEGLVQDPKALPCFSSYELFEHLTKQQKINRAQIQHKLTHLCAYLTRDQSSGTNSPLSTLLCLKMANSPNFIKETKVLFDGALMSLFAFAFKFRIEVFSETCGRLTAQYFGLKDSYTIRLMFVGDSFVLLKKKCKKALRLATSSATKAAVRPASSVNTSFEAEDAFKLERNSSANTRSSSTDQNGASDAVDRFSATEQKSDAKSIDSSFFCASKCGKDSSKMTGHLKFYNESKEYGFIIMEDQSEIFVHKLDLVKQKIDTRFLAYYKQFYNIVIEFNVQEYKGRGKTYRKAVDLAIRDMITAI